MSQKFTIFFSWQSDIKGTRNIIVNAIKAEIQKIKEDKGYVVAIPDKPCGCYDYKKGEIESFAEELGYFDEEYALFSPKRYLPRKIISRQEYDDGATFFAGRQVKTCGKAELRLRYLTPYNFIIAAKFSPFNSPDFCSVSENVFKGMLNGTVSDEEFGKFMKAFPKREW